MTIPDTRQIITMTAETAVTTMTTKAETRAIQAKPKTTGSSKCDYETCKLKHAMIIGDCAYCAFKYCAQHRLPELHKCSNLDVCCKNAKKENSDRLASQALSMVMKV